jgi:hypothetical protein
MIDLRTRWQLSVGMLLNDFAGSTTLRHLETLDLRTRMWSSQWDYRPSWTLQDLGVFCPTGRLEEDALAWLARPELSTGAAGNLRKEIGRGGSGQGYPRQEGCLLIVRESTCANQYPHLPVLIGESRKKPSVNGCRIGPNCLGGRTFSRITISMTGSDGIGIGSAVIRIAPGGYNWFFRSREAFCNLVACNSRVNSSTLFCN